MSVSDVHLEPIDRSNWRRALQIRSNPDQLKFVAEHEPVALVILAKSYIRPEGWTWQPFSIVADDTMVGIVALAHSGSNCEMLHLVIDHSFQGRGLGRATVERIVDLIRRDLPDCKELTLTVHPDNERAQRLYASLGFQATGGQRDGELVWQLKLDEI